jgi:hypothetical protein
VKPVGDRRFDLVAVRDANEIGVLERRTFHHVPDLGCLDRATEHDPDLEIFRFRPNEEVTDLPREHDRVVRGVNALLAELDGRFVNPLVCLSEILG